MRRSKERRKQKTPKPLEKVFKHSVVCIKCGKGFLVAKEGLDLSNLACDICKGKLKYRKGKWKTYAHALKKSKHKMKGEEASVKELLKQLTETKDSEEKRRLRRLLRRRGHHGGLGKRKETDIKYLLNRLKETKDSEEKKRLRRLLRRRGHSGGLGKRNLTKEQANGKKKKKKRMVRR